MRRAPSAVTTVITWVLGLVMLVLVLCGGGCEAIVSGTIEDFRCGSDATSACPPGQVCATTTGQCVDASTACSVIGCTAPLVCNPGSQECESSTPDDASHPMDSGSDTRADTLVADTAMERDVVVDAGCTGTGCPCAVGHNTCASGSFCAEATAVPGLTIPSAFCTQPCCTSADCSGVAVCYASGGPGNYCVPPTALARGELGSSAGGASCTTNDECRSGACTAGSCFDTCCPSTACAGGTTCSLGSLSASSPVGFFCLAPQGSRAVGDSCTNSSECESQVCLADVCSLACCGSTACMQPFPLFGACESVGVPQMTGSVAVCTTNYNFEATPFGGACTKDTDCASQNCDPSAKTCTDLCCKDSDCMNGYACRPTSGASPYLICVSSP